MGKLLARLLRFGRDTPEGSANRHAHAADFRAVSIVPTASSCAEARRVRKTRYLLNEAPRLPLPQCPQALTCECKYRKFSDRRVEERRDIGSSNRWYRGPDRRTLSGRRAADHHLSRIEIQWPGPGPD